MKEIKMMLYFTLDFDGQCEGIDSIEVDNIELNLEDVDIEFEDIDNYVSTLKTEFPNFKVSRNKTEVIVIVYENKTLVKTHNYNSPDWNDYDMFEYEVNKPLPIEVKYY